MLQPPPLANPRALETVLAVSVVDVDIVVVPAATEREVAEWAASVVLRHASMGVVAVEPLGVVADETVQHDPFGAVAGLLEVVSLAAAVPLAIWTAATHYWNKRCRGMTNR